MAVLVASFYVVKGLNPKRAESHLGPNLATLARLEEPETRRDVMSAPSPPLPNLVNAPAYIIKEVGMSGIQVIAASHVIKFLGCRPRTGSLGH